MREKSIGIKWKKGLGRWLAMAMTISLLAGQCNIPALAEEDTESGQESSVSDNDIEDSIENNIPQCVCTVKCREENINGECAVCLVDYMQCNSEIVEEGISEDLSVPDTSVEEVKHETVSENSGEVYEEDVEITSVDTAMPYASDSYVESHIKYKVYGERKVEVVGYEEGQLSAHVVIPSHVEFNDTVWDVNQIRQEAFRNCDELISIDIPGSVQRIGSSAFYDCGNLQTVVLHEGTQEIGNSTFRGCRNLAEIVLPDSVVKMLSDAFVDCTNLKSATVGRGMNYIEDNTFAYCSGLRKVTIPDSVTDIRIGAFRHCDGLSVVDIPNSVRSINVMGFSDCKNLKYMKIAVDTESGQSIEPIEIKLVSNYTPTYAFYGLPYERYIVFMNKDGTEQLTGDVLEMAKKAYLEDSSDLNDSDNKWYGWQIGDLADIKDTYSVTINVRKDGVRWENHNRTFALLANGGSEFLYDLEHVPNGTYRIYDVTGVRRDSLWSKAADTGVSVRVNGADTEVDVTVDGADEEATVDYYTVTFYDKDDPYGADTDQRPQEVLKGKAVVRPNDPGRADHVFTGWVTAKDSSTPFDFTNTRIGDTTGIYASWRIADTATDIIIEASASEGGSISPAGSVSVERGTDKTFTITPNDSYHIKSVSADGQEVTAEGEGTSRTYTFHNVTENHAIHATFEKNSGGNDGDNKPGGGDNPPDGTTGDNGGGSTPDNGNDPSGGSGTDDGNSDTASDDSANNTVSDSTVITANAENNMTAVTTDNSAVGSATATDTGNPAAPSTPQGKEPKTGDTAHVEMYATVAMIAGLAYILLYFMDADRGMTEREKEVFVAAFIRWAKRGSGIRKYFALAAIFCLLVYYHGIGKRVRADWKEAYVK